MWPSDVKPLHEPMLIKIYGFTRLQCVFIIDNFNNTDPRRVNSCCVKIYTHFISTCNIPHPLLNFMWVFFKWIHSLAPSVACINQWIASTSDELKAWRIIVTYLLYIIWHNSEFRIARKYSYLKIPPPPQKKKKKEKKRKENAKEFFSEICRKCRRKTICHRIQKPRSQNSMLCCNRNHYVTYLGLLMMETEYLGIGD